MESYSWQPLEASQIAGGARRRRVLRDDNNNSFRLRGDGEGLVVTDGEDKGFLIVRKGRDVYVRNLAGYMDYFIDYLPALGGTLGILAGNALAFKLAPSDLTVFASWVVGADSGIRVGEVLQSLLGGSVRYRDAEVVVMNGYDSRGRPIPEKYAAQLVVIETEDTIALVSGSAVWTIESQNYYAPKFSHGVDAAMLVKNDGTKVVVMKRPDNVIFLTISDEGVRSASVPLNVADKVAEKQFGLIGYALSLDELNATKKASGIADYLEGSSVTDNFRRRKTARSFGGGFRRLEVEQVM